MKSGVVLCDTGPLVAFLNRRDRYHLWAKNQLAQLAPPLFTCEAVLSEACFLLRHLVGGPDAVPELLARGLIKVPFHLDDEAPRVGVLLRSYAEIPMSLADACLVRMAERMPGAVVWTLDSDFRIYRTHRNRELRVNMPE